MKLTIKPLLLTFSMGIATLVNAQEVKQDTMASTSAMDNQTNIAMEIWKSPTCGCCNDWITHMEHNGFSVKINDTGNAEVRKKFNIGNELASCHTAVVEGYVIEGHVPAEKVKRLLAEKPDAVGLTVPGMPIGSPGMDGEIYQGRKDPYEVILIKKEGQHQVFKAYNQ